MAEFNIRSESVDVEQIMQQIRARIREKRGVDYTEEQVRELATVRLEKFLDPKNLRSDLLEQFRRSRPGLPDPAAEPPAVDPPYVLDEQTLFTSHRRSLRWVRTLLKPLLMLFFNPNTLSHILHSQAQFNVDMLKRDQRRKIEMQSFNRDWNVLYYEVLHNLVLETTRSAIELKNLKMRVEALASRLDFSERRVRALEGVVQYRPEVVRPRERLHASRGEGEIESGEVQDESAVPTGEGAPPPTGPLTPGEARRRRRRRRGRRSGGMVGGPPTGDAPAADRSAEEGVDAADQASMNRTDGPRAHDEASRSASASTPDADTSPDRDSQ